MEGIQTTSIVTRMVSSSGCFRYKGKLLYFSVKYAGQTITIKDSSETPFDRRQLIARLGDLEKVFVL